MEIVFPPNSTARANMSPWGWNPCPSKALRVVGDVTSSGEPRAFQQVRDKIEVEAPSSSTVQNILFPTTFIMI